MQMDRAELRFGISDPRGLGANPRVSVDGRPLRLQPGGGSGGGRGFFAWLDAGALNAKPMAVEFAFDVRGNEALSIAPQAGDTRWTVHSSWPSPSFGGDFLPGERTSPTRVSTPPIASAISHSAGRWSRPGTPARPEPAAAMPSAGSAAAPPTAVPYRPRRSA